MVLWKVFWTCCIRDMVEVFLVYKNYLPLKEILMYYENQITDVSKWAHWPGPKSPAAKGSCCYWNDMNNHEQIQDNGHNGKQWTRNTPGCVAHSAWSTSIAFFQRAPFSRALTLSGKATFTSTLKGLTKTGFHQAFAEENIKTSF